MNACFRKYFVEHPESVGENYFTHGVKAFTFGTKFIAFSIAELIHTVVPGIDVFELFETKSFIEIKKIYDELKMRKGE